MRLSSLKLECTQDEPLLGLTLYLGSRRPLSWLAWFRGGVPFQNLTNELTYEVQVETWW